MPWVPYCCLLSLHRAGGFGYHQPHRRAAEADGHRLCRGEGEGSSHRGHQQGHQHQGGQAPSKYENLMAIKTDNQGKVSLVQPNTGEINRLASRHCHGGADSAEEADPAALRHPPGPGPGRERLRGHGSEVFWVSVIPIGSVTANVTDNFEQAGINQTRHQDIPGGQDGRPHRRPAGQDIGRGRVQGSVD